MYIDFCDVIIVCIHSFYYIEAKLKKKTDNIGCDTLCVVWKKPLEGLVV
jgi:hypothetical protein